MKGSKAESEYYQLYAGITGQSNKSPLKRKKASDWSNSEAHSNY